MLFGSRVGWRQCIITPVYSMCVLEAICRAPYHWAVRQCVSIAEWVTVSHGHAALATSYIFISGSNPAGSEPRGATVIWSHYSVIVLDARVLPPSSPLRTGLLLLFPASLWLTVTLRSSTAWTEVYCKFTPTNTIVGWMLGDTVCGSVLVLKGATCNIQASIDHQHGLRH